MEVGFEVEVLFDTEIDPDNEWYQHSEHWERGNISAFSRSGDKVKIAYHGFGGGRTAFGHHFPARSEWIALDDERIFVHHPDVHHHLGGNETDLGRAYRKLQASPESQPKGLRGILSFLTNKNSAVYCPVINKN
jgi:hypothetical protein